jgi:sulfonate transport system permease protein
MKALRSRFLGFAVVALLIALWQAISDMKLISPVYLPGPDRAFAALVHGLTRSDLGAKLIGTIEHMIEGWLAASIVGVALGALIGSSRQARAFIAPTLEFLRPLPASAIIPVAIAIFGLSPAMALGVIAFGAIWPMLLATVHGFAAVEPRLYEVAKALRLTRAEVILKIALPSATPDVLAGLRLGLTVALILAVVCEMIAGLNGLGNWVLLAARMFRSADLFAGVILLGAVGFVGALALNIAERRLLAWRAT